MSKYLEHEIFLSKKLPNLSTSYCSLYKIGRHAHEAKSYTTCAFENLIIFHFITKEKKENKQEQRLLVEEMN